jgi:hypothetical protein
MKSQILIVAKLKTPLHSGEKGLSDKATISSQRSED